MYVNNKCILLHVFYLLLLNMKIYNYCTFLTILIVNIFLPVSCFFVKQSQHMNKHFSVFIRMKEFRKQFYTFNRKRTLPKANSLLFQVFF